MNGIFSALNAMLKNLFSVLNPYGSDTAWDNYRSSRALEAIAVESEPSCR